MIKKIIVSEDDLDRLSKRIKVIRKEFKGKKFKQKEITIEEYNKRIDKITKLKLPVHEILIKLLEFAGTVDIREERNEKR